MGEEYKVSNSTEAELDLDTKTTMSCGLALVGTLQVLIWGFTNQIVVEQEVTN